MTTPRTITLAGTEVARIGLGTNRLTPDRVDFVRDAVEAGIEHIDTAHLYTGGESEATIGAAREAGAEPKLVATKGGYRPGEGRPDVLRSQVEESLRRLRTDSIQLYYLHRVDPDTPLEESLGALREMRDEGKIQNVGISEVSIEQIERARQVVEIAAVQNHYSLSDRQHDDVDDYFTHQRTPFVP